MRNGEWDFSPDRPDRIVYYRDDWGTIHIADGHKRVNAALELGSETGDWSYLGRLLESGKREAVPPPATSARFPTRSWWSRFLDWLGL
jgi:hypothetical protein